MLGNIATNSTSQIMQSLRKFTDGSPSSSMGGDHLQLPPVPKTTLLLAPTEGASDEQKLGASMFRNLEYLFEMHTMMRFKDPDSGEHTSENADARRCSADGSMNGPSS